MQFGRLRSINERLRVLLGAGGLAGVALCWMLLTPPGAAADEPSHLTRSAALANGQLQGEPIGNGLDIHELPDRYRLPEPGCYAFQPSVPVTCAEIPAVNGDPTVLATRADEYPLWGHLVYGIPTLLPGLAPIWWARICGAAIALAFVVASLRLRPTAWGATGIVVALTPMWWATVSTVNPSSFGIAGAIGLWTALFHRQLDHPRAVAWLTALGWAALALPRRDGLIWASMIVVIALAATNRSTLSWVRSLGLGPQVIVGLSTVVTVVWGLTQGGRTTQMVALSPLLLIAYEGVYRAWTTFASSLSRRLTLGFGLVVIGAGLTAGLLQNRPGGWDSDLARTVVGQTRANLVEAIGRLGWLDTPLPRLVPLLALLTIGLLVVATAQRTLRPVVVAAVILLTLVLTSWVFELFQGNTSGQYWQGRYSLPLLVGIPITLTAAPIRPQLTKWLAPTAIVSALLVVNVAAWSAARRWGVGVNGSMRPWAWGTEHSLIDPLALLTAHAAITGMLAVVLTDVLRPKQSAAASSDEPLDEPVSFSADDRPV